MTIHLYEPPTRLAGILHDLHVGYWQRAVSGESIHLWPVDSPHKGLITQKTFACHAVIMRTACSIQRPLQICRSVVYSLPSNSNFVDCLCEIGVWDGFVFSCNILPWCENQYREIKLFRFPWIIGVNEEFGGRSSYLWNGWIITPHSILRGVRVTPDPVMVVSLECHKTQPW